MPVAYLPPEGDAGRATANQRQSAVSELCENYRQTSTIVGRHRSKSFRRICPIATHSVGSMPVVSELSQHSTSSGRGRAGRWRGGRRRVEPTPELTALGDGAALIGPINAAREPVGPPVTAFARNASATPARRTDCALVRRLAGPLVLSPRQPPRLVTQAERRRLSAPRDHHRPRSPEPPGCQ